MGVALGHGGPTMRLDLPDVVTPAWAATLIGSG